ncbi:10062_t:CDS:2, partial [Ambispora gerdemannii]
MTFKKPAECWTFDAIASHYYDDNICRTLDNIKKDLQRRAKMEDCDAQKAEKLLDSGWKPYYSWSYGDDSWSVLTRHGTSCITLGRTDMTLGRKKLATAVKTRVTVDQIRSKAITSTFADGAESMSKVRKAILDDIDSIALISTALEEPLKDYEEYEEAFDSTPVDYSDNLNETDFSDSDHEEKYEPSNNSSISSDSDHNQKKK